MDTLAFVPACRFHVTEKENELNEYVAVFVDEAFRAGMRFGVEQWQAFVAEPSKPNPLAVLDAEEARRVAKGR